MPRCTASAISCRAAERDACHAQAVQLDEELDDEIQFAQLGPDGELLVGLFTLHLQPLASRAPAKGLGAAAS